MILATLAGERFLFCIPMIFCPHFLFAEGVVEVQFIARRAHNCCQMCRLHRVFSDFSCVVGHFPKKVFEIVAVFASDVGMVDNFSTFL